MTALHYIDISETVNNQHAKDCGWKKLSDVLNKCRSFFILTKYDERKKTCGHGARMHRPMVMICCASVIL